MIPFETKKEVTVCGFPFDCKIEGTIDHQKEETDTGIPESYRFDEITVVEAYDYANAEYVAIQDPLKRYIAEQFERDNKAAECLPEGPL